MNLKHHNWLSKLLGRPLSNTKQGKAKVRPIGSYTTRVPSILHELGEISYALFVSSNVQYFNQS